MLSMPPKCSGNAAGEISGFDGGGGGGGGIRGQGDDRGDGVIEGECGDRFRGGESEVVEAGVCCRGGRSGF